MKKLITVLLCLFATTAFAQADNPGAKRLSKEDSIKIDEFWNKANSVRVVSPVRQLYLDSALAIAPWMAYFWQQKAMPLSKQMKYELAAPFLDSAVKYNPKKYLDYRAYMKCIFHKDYKGALQDFYASKALNGNSGVMDHPYNFYIGLCHLQLNNFDSCKYYMQQCIDEKLARTKDVKWTHSLHWYYLSIACFEKGNIAEAKKKMDTALVLNPTFPDAHYYYSIYLEEDGDIKGALEQSKITDSLFLQGYDMNEDGGRYEHYPYQANRYFLKSNIEWLEEQLAAKK